MLMISVNDSGGNGIRDTLQYISHLGIHGFFDKHYWNIGTISGFHHLRNVSLENRINFIVGDSHPTQSECPFDKVLHTGHKR